MKKVLIEMQHNHLETFLATHGVRTKIRQKARDIFDYLQKNEQKLYLADENRLNEIKEEIEDITRNLRLLGLVFGADAIENKYGHLTRVEKEELHKQLYTQFKELRNEERLLKGLISTRNQTISDDIYLMTDYNVGPQHVPGLIDSYLLDKQVEINSLVRERFIQAPDEMSDEIIQYLHPRDEYEEEEDLQGESSEEKE